MSNKVRKEQVQNSSGSGNIDYSDGEQLTGNYFFGKPIYQKTILYNKELPGSSGTVAFAHGIKDIENVIDIIGIVNDPKANVYIRTPHVGVAQANESISFYISGDDIILKVGQDRSSYINNHITVYYTKTTSSKKN